jgi:hypothetical protein
MALLFIQCYAPRNPVKWFKALSEGSPELESRGAESMARIHFTESAHSSNKNEHTDSTLIDEKEKRIASSWIGVPVPLVH